VGNAITWKSYDKMGRPAEEWQCTPVNCGTGTFALPYTYGLAGELLTFTNGAGVTLTNQYDTAAQVTNIASSLQDSNHQSPLLTNPTYNAPGLVTALQLGNGVNESYNYDDRLRLTTMTAGSVYSLTMGYAPDSDVSSAIDSANGSWTYTYDAFNRLSASNQNSGATKFTYAYDRYGNRWQQNVTAGSGPSSSLSFSGGSNRVDGDSYDAAGNLLSDGLHSYTYDAENRIIKVDTGSTAIYVYDAFGQRIQKTSSVGTASYLYDFAGKEVTEINSSATWTRTEVYAGGKHLATYSGGASGTTTYIHADWLGTERVRTGVSGAASETCTSLPFGDGQTCTGTDASPMHFTGKHWDTESNLDDFGARYYSSGMARWVTPDWSARQEAVPYVDLGNPQSLNLYAYVGNNPTTATDATGHARWSIGGWNIGCWFNKELCGSSTTPSTTTNDSNSPSNDSPDKGPAQKQNPSVGSELLALGKAAMHQGYENEFHCGGSDVCTGGLPGPVGLGGAAAKVIEGGEAAAELVKLGKSIASDAQMAAKGQSFAGAGAPKALKDAGRLASTYGGKLADWAKMTSKAFRAGDGSVISTHWYENVASGIKVEYKSIIDSAAWSK